MKTKPPLLILHGFTGSGASFAMRLPHLAHHYHLLAPNLPGHGNPPDLPRFAYADALSDLAQFCDRHSASRLPVLGYSMGGRVALGFALQFPERVSALILESASPGLPTASEQHARQQADSALAQRILADGIPTFVQEWETLPLWHSQQRLPDATKLALRQQRLMNDAQGLANSLLGMGTGAQPYLGNRLAELAMPVLLIAGALDAKFVQIAHDMAQKIAHAQMVIVPDVGHAVHLEAPHAYQSAVSAFLSA